jgi:hypothetical protein
MSGVNLPQAIDWQKLYESWGEALSLSIQRLCLYTSSEHTRYRASGWPLASGSELLAILIKSINHQMPSPPPVISFKIPFPV